LNFSEDQIRQLSPDESSTKAGLQLATPAKWVNAHKHEKALWGACQGSGKEPYSTMIDLQSIAFKCNCPSRKFPCKHGVGLLFLSLKYPNHFKAETELDSIVSDWLNKRDQKTQTAAAKPDKPIDEKAQQKRAEQRVQKVNAGVKELEVWMKDLVRTGIQQIPNNIYSFAANIKARMVDAQATGLVGKLKDIEAIDFYKSGWEEKFISKLSKIYLLIKAYENTSLSEQWQSEIKQLIGWNTPKEEVLNTKPFNDNWLIAGIEKTQVDQLLTEKIWLYGIHSKQFACQMNFYANNQLPQQLFIPGSIIKGDVHFYPAIFPIRCILNQYVTESNLPDIFNESGAIEAMLNTQADRLTLNPFIEQSPFVLTQVYVHFYNHGFLLKDKNHSVFNLKIMPEKAWTIIAFSQGAPINVFGYIQDDAFIIVSFWNQFHFYNMLDL
jgi:hypothetical protein